MQVFWVSGAVGKISSFNLSLKTIVLGCALLVLLLLTTGSAMQFFGFRLALEYDPQIARRLGNLHTALELENLNAVYRARLQELEREQQTLIGKVRDLEAANVKLADTLIPKSVASLRPQTRAQGGAYLPSVEPTAGRDASVLGAIQRLRDQTQTQNGFLSSAVSTWQAQIDFLEQLPVSLPVDDGRAAISSGFGNRADPITRQTAFHAGLDFELPLQTPILAAGAGRVSFAGWDGPYGYTVVIRHQHGFSSRYAHASQLLVREGSVVAKGQVIARSGNSGRSTGPHLHFEVIRNSQTLDPAAYLIAMTARPGKPL